MFVRCGVLLPTGGHFSHSLLTILSFKALLVLPYVTKSSIN